jgi:hypothetical protein
LSFLTRSRRAREDDRSRRPRALSSRHDQAARDPRDTPDRRRRGSPRFPGPPSRLALANLPAPRPDAQGRERRRRRASRAPPGGRRPRHRDGRGAQVVLRQPLQGRRHVLAASRGASVGMEKKGARGGARIRTLGGESSVVVVVFARDETYPRGVFPSHRPRKTVRSPPVPHRLRRAQANAADDEAAAVWLDEAEARMRREYLPRLREFGLPEDVACFEGEPCLTLFFLPSYLPPL